MIRHAVTTPKNEVVPKAEPQAKGAPKNGLIFSCSMDSNEDIAASKGIFKELSFVDGINGNALKIPAGKGGPFF